MKFSARMINWLIIVYCSVILLISVVSLNGSTALNKSKTIGLRTDYLLHVLLFIPWMVLAKWRLKGINSNIYFWFALGVGIIFAGFSEVVQIFVPDRSFNVIDLLANSLGIVIGALIVGWGWRSAR
ncbi:MAG: VanZ family protein [Thermodesulfovibrionales bacterium]|nr:VanZ family protein [Thermodesulfovibrionales bacterium]